MTLVQMYFIQLLLQTGRQLNELIDLALQFAVVALQFAVVKGLQIVDSLCEHGRIE